MTDQSYRVVQWATGTIGRRSLHTIIEHRDLDLVGVHVYAPDKVGVDAGELCGVDPTGVSATGTVDDVLALRPDCVIYMPRAADLDDLCRLLSAGINVVEGDAPLDVDLRIDVPLERMAELSAGLTAHRAVNAVPVVCKADSGIRTTADLPQVIARLAR